MTSKQSMFEFFLKKWKGERDDEEFDISSFVSAHERDAKRVLLYAATLEHSKAIRWSITRDQFIVPHDAPFWFEPFEFEPLVDIKKTNFGKLNEIIAPKLEKGRLDIPTEFSQFMRETENNKVHASVPIAAILEARDGIYNAYLEGAKEKISVEELVSQIKYVIDTIGLCLKDALRYKNDKNRLTLMAGKIAKLMLILVSAIEKGFPTEDASNLLEIVKYSIASGIYMVSYAVIEMALETFGSVMPMFQQEPDFVRGLKDENMRDLVLSTAVVDPLSDNAPLQTILFKIIEKNQDILFDSDLKVRPPTMVSMLQYMIGNGYITKTDVEKVGPEGAYTAIQLLFQLKKKDLENFPKRFLPKSVIPAVEYIFVDHTETVNAMIKTLSTDTTEMFPEVLRQIMPGNSFEYLKYRPYTDMFLLIAIHNNKYRAFSGLLKSFPQNCLNAFADMDSKKDLKKFKTGLPEKSFKMSVFSRFSSTVSSSYVPIKSPYFDAAVVTMIDITSEKIGDAIKKADFAKYLLDWASDTFEGLKEKTHERQEFTEHALSLARSICESSAASSFKVVHSETTSLARLAFKEIVSDIKKWMPMYWRIVKELAPFLVNLPKDEFHNILYKYLREANPEMVKLVKEVVQNLDKERVKAFVMWLSANINSNLDEENQSRYTLTAISVIISPTLLDKNISDILEQKVLPVNEAQKYLGSLPKIHFAQRSLSLIKEGTETVSYEEVKDNNNNNNNNNTPARRIMPITRDVIDTSGVSGSGPASTTKKGENDYITELTRVWLDIDKKKQEAETEKKKQNEETKKQEAERKKQEKEKEVERKNQEKEKEVEKKKQEKETRTAKNQGTKLLLLGEEEEEEEEVGAKKKDTFVPTGPNTGRQFIKPIDPNLLGKLDKSKLRNSRFIENPIVRVSKEEDDETPKKLAYVHNYGTREVGHKLSESDRDIYLEIDQYIETDNESYLEEVRTLGHSSSNFVQLKELVEAMKREVSPGAVLDTLPAVIRAFFSEGGRLDPNSVEELRDLWGGFMELGLNSTKIGQIEFMGEIMGEALVFASNPKHPEFVAYLMEWITGFTKILRERLGYPELCYYKIWTRAFAYALVETELTATSRIIEDMLKMGLYLDEKCPLIVREDIPREGMVVQNLTLAPFSATEEFEILDYPMVFVARLSSDLTTRLPHLMEIIKQAGQEISPLQVALMWNTENWRTVADSGLIPNKRHIAEALTSCGPEESVVSVYIRVFAKYRWLVHRGNLPSKEEVTSPLYKRDLEKHMDNYVLKQLRIHSSSWFFEVFVTAKDVECVTFLFESLPKVFKDPAILVQALEVMDENGWHDAVRELKDKYSVDYEPELPAKQN